MAGNRAAKRGLRGTWPLLAAALALLGTLPLHATPDTKVIAGTVRHHGVPISGAAVRLQTTAVSAVTNERGVYELRVSAGRVPLRLTASAPGFYIAAAVSAHFGEPVDFELKPLPQSDNPEYHWIDPFSTSNSKASCQNCHSERAKRRKLPFDEWMTDAHGRSAVSPRFLSVYRGTDLTGNGQSPTTKFAVVPDYGRVALRPDLSRPYFGPGYQLDFPGTGGDCAACHAPAAAMRAPYSTRADQLASPHADGITCDFCHKIRAVQLDPENGRPFPNTPGVLSFKFLRPATNEQVFFGPLDDVAPGDDTFSPLHRTSEFCAPCHSAQFWGVQVYDSFGEWLESPYSRGAEARTCQDCHMPRRGAKYFVRLARGGRLRDPHTIYSHQMLGPGDAAFLRSAARLELAAVPHGDVLEVAAKVSNIGAGHSLPTDHPGRNVLLLVSAASGGAELPLLDGPRVPAWAAENVRPDAAEAAGKCYARVLKERWTDVAPTIAYWNPTVVLSDTRIPAKQSDSSIYRFRLPRSGKVQVIARLVYRRAFPELAQSKNWPNPEILMQEQKMVIRTR